MTPLKSEKAQAPAPSSAAGDESLVALEAVYERVSTGKAPFAAFVEAIGTVDWPSQSPLVFNRAIDLALGLNAVKIARELAASGQRTHPENENLARAARVLAPPRVIEINRPPIMGLSASMAWLREHAAEYSGLWIAVQDGKLLGAAASRNALVELLGDTVGQDAIIARIP